MLSTSSTSWTAPPYTGEKALEISQQMLIMMKLQLIGKRPRKASELFILFVMIEKVWKQR